MSYRRDIKKDECHPMAFIYKMIELDQYYGDSY